MRIRFTKMHGAGNDFVVLDETRGPLGLSVAQYRFLADRHFGIGADQILSVRAPDRDDLDFRYVIHNADGQEVEHCGNGARCLVRFVREQGLTAKHSVRVQTLNTRLTLIEQPDGRVTVDMGAPVFDAPAIPFQGDGLAQRLGADAWPLWALPAPELAQHTAPSAALGGALEVAVLSMGNPHAVHWLADGDVDAAPLAQWGPWVQQLPAFPKGVNLGFAQALSRQHIRLRVYERGVGETLACGTGACAAVVAGIRLGLLDAAVEVDTRGGRLHIAWEGGSAAVLMTGPAQTVFEGAIDLPENL
jgi:diaminopimelate epimerase